MSEDKKVSATFLCHPVSSQETVPDTFYRPRLVLASRKPAAQMFKRWICHEVLPSIRLHGCYPPPPVPRNPTSLMLRQLADSLERQDALEVQQTELAGRLEYVAGKVRDMDGDTRYVTVLAYGRLKHLDMPRKDAQRHGKALTKIHRERGIKIGQVPDERHGQVHAYRIDVVGEYFAGMVDGHVGRCPGV